MVTDYKQTDVIPIILTGLLSIMSIFFLIIYVYVGDRNGIFNNMEAISLTLFLFSTLCTIYSGYSWSD